MALTRLTADVANISKLDNTPKDDAGFSPSYLKATFDKAGMDIKAYLNNTLTPQIEALVTLAGTNSVDMATGLLTQPRKNLLHNSHFQIWQRGETFAFTADKSIVADRWKVYGGTWAITKQLDTDKQPYIRFVNTHPTDAQSLYFYQILEDYAMHDGEQMTATLQVRGYNGYAGPVYMRAGSAGVANITLTTGWGYVTTSPVFAAGTSSYEKGVLLNTSSSYMVPVGGGIEIKAAKLEQGTVSTLRYDLMPDYGEQLGLCHRYALSFSGTTYFRAAYITANTLGFIVPTPATLRINPTPTVAPTVCTTALAAETGFTFVYALYDNCVRVVATKTAHGLADATLSVPAGVWAAELI